MPLIGTSSTIVGTRRRTHLFSRWLAPRRRYPVQVGPRPTNDHTNAIWSLAFVPGSDLVVSGSHDGTCKVWNAQDVSKVVGESMFHGPPVYAVVVFGNGSMMASGGYDGRIVVWNLENRERMLEWDTGQRSVDLLSLSADGNMLSTGSDRGLLSIWSPSTGKLISGPRKLHAAAIRAVSFSPDGSKVATASSDKTIRVVHSRSGKDILPAIEAHGRAVTSVVWSPGGQQLISGSVDTTLKFFDSSTGLLLATCRGHTNTITSIVVSPNGELVVSAAEDATVRLWSTSTFQQIGIARRHPDRVFSVALSPDGHYLAVAGRDKKVRIWVVKRRSQLPPITSEPESTPSSAAASGSRHGSTSSVVSAVVSSGHRPRAWWRRSFNSTRRAQEGEQVVSPSTEMDHRLALIPRVRKPNRRSRIKQKDEYELVIPSPYRSKLARLSQGPRSRVRSRWNTSRAVLS
ncbi:WD40 repeat-like protein [Gyrodon lividus]|nr:WD40 repeat-like protein [Gyrodon lividus]